MKPIGVEPKAIWLSKRQGALGMAIMKYIDAWLPVPQDWIDEYNELAKELKKEK